jgi:hypothetical protein
MHGLELINDQLEMVARGSIDWSRQGEVMDSVDAELAQLHQLIKMVISTHQYLIEIDDICAREIEAGKKSPNTEAHSLLEKALALFRHASAELLSAAREFTRKGIPVTDLGILRKIEADPGAGLYMAKMLRLASELDAGENQPPREVPLSAQVHDALSRQSNPHRMIG